MKYMEENWTALDTLSDEDEKSIRNSIERVQICGPLLAAHVCGLQLHRHSRARLACDLREKIRRHRKLCCRVPFKK
jgi:hypothetical protein